MRNSLLFSFEHSSGYVHGPNHEKYNHLHEDSINDIRGKCGLVFSVNIPNALIKELPYRFYDFAALGSIKRAFDEAEHQYSCQRFIAHKEGKMPPSYASILTKNISYFVFKDFTQIATFPFYIIARQIAALWGMLFPLDGMHMLGKLQEIWALDTRLIKTRFFCSKEEGGLHKLFLQKIFFLFIAPCMLQRSFFRKRNLYFMIEENRSERSTLRSLHLTLSNYVKRHKPYFDEKILTNLCNGKIEERVRTLDLMQQDIVQAMQANLEQALQAAKNLVALQNTLEEIHQQAISNKKADLQNSIDNLTCHLNL